MRHRAFLESARLTVPSSGAEFLVSGDVNGDGKPDLLMKSSPYWIQVALGDGTGQFTVLSNKIDVGNASTAALADIDGDGMPDLVTGGMNSVKLFRGVGNGQFVLRRMTNLTPINDLSAPVRTATSVVVGDFNGDRRLDVAFPLFSATNVRIQLTDAQGLVASEQTKIRRPSQRHAPLPPGRHGFRPRRIPRSPLPPQWARVDR